MRKFIFIIIAVIAVAVTFGWVRSCHEDKTDTEMFGQKLTCADIYEYKNPDFGFAIRYPSFFEKQPDSLNTSKGRVRFSYNDQWATVVKEVDNWQIWERKRPQLRQGESQTPKAR